MSLYKSTKTNAEFPFSDIAISEYFAREILRQSALFLLIYIYKSEIIIKLEQFYSQCLFYHSFFPLVRQFISTFTSLLLRKRILRTSYFSVSLLLFQEQFYCCFGSNVILFAIGKHIRYFE